MSQYVGQSDPGVDFLFIQFGMYIVESQNTKMFFPYCYIRYTDGQVDRFPFIGESSLKLISGLARRDKLHKAGIDAAELSYMCEYIESE